MAVCSAELLKNNIAVQCTATTKTTKFLTNCFVETKEMRDNCERSQVREMSY